MPSFAGIRWPSPTTLPARCLHLLFPARSRSSGMGSTGHLQLCLTRVRTRKGTGQNPHLFRRCSVSSPLPSIFIYNCSFIFPNNSSQERLQPQYLEMRKSGLQDVKWFTQWPTAYKCRMQIKTQIRLTTRLRLPPEGERLQILWPSQEMAQNSLALYECSEDTLRGLPLWLVQTHFSGARSWIQVGHSVLIIAALILCQQRASI